MRAPVMILFVLAPVLVIAQTVVREAVIEPFPALLMPSFGGVPAAGQLYDVRRGTLVLTDDSGVERRLPSYRLADGARVVPELVVRLLASDSLDAAGRFKGRDARSPAVLRLLGQRAGRTRDDRSALVDHPEVQRWLRGRARDLLDGGEPGSARIEWHRLSVDRTTQRVVADRVVQRVELFPR